MELNNFSKLYQFASKDLQKPNIQLFLYFSRKRDINYIQVDNEEVSIESIQQMPKRLEIVKLATKVIRFLI